MNPIPKTVADIKSPSLQAPESKSMTPPTGPRDLVIEMPPPREEEVPLVSLHVAPCAPPDPRLRLERMLYPDNPSIGEIDANVFALAASFLPVDQRAAAAEVFPHASRTIHDQPQLKRLTDAERRLAELQQRKTHLEASLAANQLAQQNVEAILAGSLRSMLGGAATTLGGLGLTVGKDFIEDRDTRNTVAGAGYAATACGLAVVSLALARFTRSMCLAANAGRLEAQLEWTSSAIPTAQAEVDMAKGDESPRFVQGGFDPVVEPADPAAADPQDADGMDHKHA